MNFFPSFICSAILLVGCAKIENPTQPTNNLPDFPSSNCQITPQCPNNPVNPIVKSRIELRVLGNATSVRVRSSNPNDGLTQVVTTLPYFVSFDTFQDDIFLSLEATPLNYSALTTFPFLSVQIFADGKLFREATSTDFFLTTVSVSGTWRR